MISQNQKRWLLTLAELICLGFAVCLLSDAWSYRQGWFDGIASMHYVPCNLSNWAVLP